MKKKIGKVLLAGSMIGAGAWAYKKYDTIRSMYSTVHAFKSLNDEPEVFKGKAIASLFSSVHIDLSESQFEHDEVYLDLYAVCSDVEIIIPDTMKVVLEGENHKSRVDVSQDVSLEKDKTLYINYHTRFSNFAIMDLSSIEDGCDCGCEDHHHDHDSVETHNETAESDETVTEENVTVEEEETLRTPVEDMIDEDTVEEIEEEIEDPMK